MRKRNFPYHAPANAIKSRLYAVIAAILTIAFFVPQAALAFKNSSGRARKLVAFVPALQSGFAPYDPFFATPTTVADFGAGTRPLGIAAGDFDSDNKVDLVEGRIVSGSAVITFQKGNGDGTFQTPAQFAWRVSSFNAWTFTAADLNGDGKLDLVWGSTQAASSGCTISPIPTGQTCATIGGTTLTVSPGDVRVLYGNGNGTFQENAYFVSGTRFAAGQLIGRIGVTGAGSLAIGDIDGDQDQDVVAGGIDGTNSVIKILRNDGGGTFTMSTLVSEATACANPCSPLHAQSTNAQNSPWGLAFGDADGDGDQDLWVGDRALYVYLYKNNGNGSFTLTPGQTVVSATRPNVYLAHESYRAALGFTPALSSGDINGDGKADLVLGLQSGSQTPGSNTAHDGELVLDVSNGSAHSLFGAVADIGTMARGVNVIDVDGDGARDIIAGEYDGKVKFLKQLPPIDSDGDGISDYVDNALFVANTPRLDMNTDGSANYRDQLDNDFDTVLGNPEDSSTWQRLGDGADLDDDNDGVANDVDNCRFVANTYQADRDGDGIGDACDPLDNRDTDGDGVPDGPTPGDPLYEATINAKKKWSMGKTHFVIRIDALGRFFQNEFTQIMTDGATLSPADWSVKCWENYDPGDVTDAGGSSYEPCGDDATKTLTLAGGKEVPITLVTIPKQLWTDPPVITWINDRHKNPLFELSQHGTYHVNNIPVSDWKNMSDRNFFSCEPCGLTEAENFELMRVGYDTLLGNYTNKWVAESGATSTSPKIDWSTSANPLLSYAPPYNTSDTLARKAIAQLGFKAFSASVFEEGDAGTYGSIFTPEGSHHEKFDQFGMFHASADVQLDPPATNNGAYDAAQFESYLHSQTNDGGLTTWLIEEVDWSGRPCNDDPRLTNTGADAPANCAEANGATSNRENNTVYQARWNAWMQLLDYVKNYPDGVAMTMGEVALAKGYDNAPTVPNPDQADSDHNGIGDVVDGATISTPEASLTRNQAGTLSATLKNGTGQPIASQSITFLFDANGDGVNEIYAATTGANGTASVQVTPTRAVGPTSFDVSWDGVVIGASTSGTVSVKDTTAVTLDAANPANGQITDTVTVGATLADSDGLAVASRTITFSIGAAYESATTDASGHATANITLQGPPGSGTLQAQFAGDAAFQANSASAPFTVEGEKTALVFDSTNPTSGQTTDSVKVGATLKDDDGTAVVGKVISFSIGAASANATTDNNGHASANITLQTPIGSTNLKAEFAAADVYEGSNVMSAFTILKEDTTLTLPDAIASKSNRALARATLKEADGAALAGRSIQFFVQDRIKNQTVYTSLGTVQTNSSGVATMEIPSQYISSTKRPIRATFAGDGSFIGSTASAFAYR